jgi:hypothetical protein
MGCGCKPREREQFLWYDPTNPEAEPVLYKSEVEAKAKVMRKAMNGGSGGAYTTYNPNLSIEQNIAVAQQG